MAVIDLTRLTKQFGEVVAVRDLELQIARGEVFGFLGANGAGKTTTLRLLSGLLRPSAGAVRLFDGVETARAKRRIGYVAQACSVYGDLTVAENLSFFASLYGPPDKAFLRELIDRYGFGGLRSRLARELSGGYRTRLALLAALAHRPELLLLDEPTSGVDPVTRKELWDLFYTLRAEGVTIVVTTHYMEEAERCDRLGFLVAGRLVALGSPATVRGSLAAYDLFEVNGRFGRNARTRLDTLPGLYTCNQFGMTLRLVCNKGTNSVDSIGRWLTSAGVEGNTVRLGTPTLEDAFVVLAQAGQGH